MFLSPNIPFMDETSYDALLGSATHTYSKALALSSSIGDWLNDVPSSTLGRDLRLGPPPPGSGILVMSWLGLQNLKRTQGVSAADHFWGSPCRVWGKCQ